MARVTRSERFEKIQRELTGSARWREDRGYDNMWRRMIDLYRGKHWPNTTANNEDLIAVNLAFSTINVIAPSVSVNYPKVVVTPNQPEDVDRAAFVEAVINYLWKHHDYRSPFRRAVKDFLVFGHGWIKVGWKFVEKERTLSDGERNELLDEALLEADAFAAEDPMMAFGLPSEEEIAANIPQTMSMIVEDQPFVERISPFDIFVDPEATCLEDAKWIAQRIIRPLQEAKDDKRYKPSARKQLTADSLTNALGGVADEQLDNDLTDVERTVIYEYYDVVDNTMCVMSRSGDEFLVNPTPMPYTYGHPFVMLRNYDIPDYFYPMGDLEAIESLQEELDKTRSQLVNARKRYGRKYLYHERSFGPEGREALESDEDGRLVPVVDENKPLSEVVVPMPQVPLSPEIYNFSEIIEGDINTVSGVSEYARGQMPEIRRTATEASIIADAGNARAADKLAIVELGIGHIARRVMMLMQQYMTGEQMARVADKGGTDLFVPYTREDIVGEYDYSVEAGSTQPMNDTIRKQQAVSLLNAVAPLVGTVIDPTALAKHVLTQGFGVKDPDKFIIQQQTPMDAEAAQAEAGAAPMPFGQVPLPEGPDIGAFAPTGGVPPELLAQLQNQMGMELPAL
tara:strand:+ start:2872 stop:4746 length:1875 start_codon:yes stop_codon:yes gene_type:complete